MFSHAAAFQKGERTRNELVTEIEGPVEIAKDGFDSGKRWCIHQKVTSEDVAMSLSARPEESWRPDGRRYCTRWRPRGGRILVGGWKARNGSFPSLSWSWFGGYLDRQVVCR